MTGHIIYAAAVARFSHQPIPPFEIDKARTGRRRESWLRRFQPRRPLRPATA